ncbi:hypothetical protein FF2_033003 [Malus domestica]
MAYRMHTDEERYDLYTIRQKPDESLQEYAGHFSYEYSHCVEANDKTALMAFTAGLHDCFFKYMINADTWNTYSEVMAQSYNHASTEARTYQGNPHMVNPYQQVGSGSQVLPSKEILAIQTPIASSPVSFSYSLSHQTKPITTRGIKVRIKTTRGERIVDYYDYGAKPHFFKVED